MARYRVTPEARDDLRAIREYLITQSRDAWPIVGTALRRAFQFVADSPGVGRVREDVTLHPYRFFPVKAYVVVYERAARQVRIIAVIHASRDFQRDARLR